MLTCSRTFPKVDDKRPWNRGSVNPIAGKVLYLQTPMGRSLEKLRINTLGMSKIRTRIEAAPHTHECQESCIIMRTYALGVVSDYRVLDNFGSVLH